MTTRAVAAVVALAVVTLTPAVADADPGREKDNRRCVTQREPWTTPEGMTRADVERRWEVRGKGLRHVDEFTGEREWIYPLCDLAFPENYAAAVFRDGGLWAVATLDEAPEVAQ